MNIYLYLGGHADTSAEADALQAAKMLEDFDRGLREAVAKGMSRDDIVKNAKFDQYRDVRNEYRMNLFINSYSHFLTTGRLENAYP